MTILLASQSAARRKILEQAGISFQVAPASIDETTLLKAAQKTGKNAGEAAQILACAKADFVREAHKAAPKNLAIIAADQILVCDGMWYEKPKTMAEAAQNLRALRGKTHSLVNGLVVLFGEEAWHYQDEVLVTMRDFSESFLETYLATEGDALLSSVGSYRIESRGAMLMDHIAGDYFSLLGLPLFPLLATLRKKGILAV